jgi:hypothetical protein
MLQVLYLNVGINDTRIILKCIYLYHLYQHLSIILVTFIHLSIILVTFIHLSIILVTFIHLSIILVSFIPTFKYNTCIIYTNTDTSIILKCLYK